jgi:hypothetical protein
MPICIAGDFLDKFKDWRHANGKDPMPKRRGAGYHFLAVVQQDKDKQQFGMTKYDSSQHVFDRDSLSFLADTVSGALKNLRWSTHRNATKVELRELRNRNRKSGVAQQQPDSSGQGGWKCGPHTVING